MFLSLKDMFFNNVLEFTECCVARIGSKEKHPIDFYQSLIKNLLR